MFEFVNVVGTQQDVARPITLCHVLVQLANKRDDRRKLAKCNKVLDLIAGAADPDHANNTINPGPVASDSSGRMIVGDRVAHVLRVFDFQRKKYLEISGPKDIPLRPAAIATDAADNIYVTDSELGKIVVFTRRGKFARFIGDFKGEPLFQLPTGLSIDRRTGRIFVADTPRHLIYIFDSAGNVLGRVGRRGGGAGPGELNWPTSLAVANGELLVSDAHNHRLQVFDLGGKFRRSIEISTGGEQVTAGLAVDQLGRVYMADPFLDQIKVFSPRSGWSTLPGRAGGGIGDFDSPISLWIDRGVLYLSDSGNRRIQIFRIRGEASSPEQPF